MVKSTRNGSFYGKIHYKRKFLWENPLQMEVVMGKSTINGSFYGKIHYKWKFYGKIHYKIYVFNGKIHYKCKCLQENPP